MISREHLSPVTSWVLLGLGLGLIIAYGVRYYYFPPLTDQDASITPPPTHDQQSTEDITQ